MKDNAPSGSPSHDAASLKPVAVGRRAGRKRGSINLGPHAACNPKFAWRLIKICLDETDH